MILDMSYQRHGGDHRGSATARRASKRRLLRVYGDGEHCLCALGCGTVLDFTTVERDRIEAGGPYAFWNLQPACGPCNKARSDKSLAEYVAQVG
jgi:5-methylcytosine-specific restriction endonuclease McrA